MVPSPTSLAVDPAIPQAAARIGQIHSTSNSPVLSTADDILAAAAGAVLLVWVLRGVLAARRDPLARVPLRRHDMREDAPTLAVVVYITVSLVAQWLVSFTGLPAKDMLTGFGVDATAKIAGIAACLYIGATRFAGGVNAFLFGTHRRWAVWIGAVCVGTIVAVGSCPLVFDATVTVVRRFAPQYTVHTHVTIEALQTGQLGFAATVALWTGAVALAPIAEELFFRGILQTYLGSVLKGRWTAIAVTSVAFAVMHIQQPGAMPALAVLAVLIGYLYERTGSLLTAVTIHALFNLKTLVWLALGASAT